MKRVLKTIDQDQGSLSPDLTQKRITFFDLDHTLIKGNCSALFGRYLYKKQFITFPKAVYLFSLYFLHKCKILSLSKLHRQSFSSLFKRKEKSVFSALAAAHVKKIVEEQKNLQIVRLLEEARALGEVYILSASPDFIVKEYAEHFGVTGFCATEYSEDENGVFSSVGRILDGDEKWKSAQFIANGRYSVAYSDDKVDLPLLQNVDEGYIVTRV